MLDLIQWNLALHTPLCSSLLFYWPTVGTVSSLFPGSLGLADSVLGESLRAYLPSYGTTANLPVRIQEWR